MRLGANALFTEKGFPTERFARFLRDLKVPGTTLVEIDVALQERFFPKDATTGEGMKRWALPDVLVDFPEHAVRSGLGDLGFIHKTMPSRPRYDRLGWPGAKVVRAGARLLDAIEAWNAGGRWSENVMFAGARPIDRKDESLEEVLKALQIGEPANQRNSANWFDDVATEYDMMVKMWCLAPVPDEMRALPLTLVKAPMKPNPKGGNPIGPNTVDTFRLWQEENDPKPGSLLLSSGAPYGYAQSLAAKKTLGPHGHTIDVFGHAVPSKLELKVILRELAGTVHHMLDM